MICSMCNCKCNRTSSGFVNMYTPIIILHPIKYKRCYVTNRKKKNITQVLLQILFYNMYTYYIQRQDIIYLKKEGRKG